MNKKPLYVKRNVINGDDLINWARENGLKKILNPKEMHITVVYSKTPVDWEEMAYDPNNILFPSVQTELKLFGQNKEILVLALKGYSRLNASFEYYHERGCSFDYDEYQPHVTIDYDFDGDVSMIKPYNGTLLLSKEIMEEIQDTEDYKGNISYRRL